MELKINLKIWLPSKVIIFCMLMTYQVNVIKFKFHFDINENNLPLKLTKKLRIILVCVISIAHELEKKKCIQVIKILKLNFKGAWASHVSISHSYVKPEGGICIHISKISSKMNIFNIFFSLKTTLE